MSGLVDDAGRYRSGNVGVMKGKKVVHIAPLAHRVPTPMRDLNRWNEKLGSLPVESMIHSHPRT